MKKVSIPGRLEAGLAQRCQKVNKVEEFRLARAKMKKVGIGPGLSDTLVTRLIKLVFWPGLSLS